MKKFVLIFMLLVLITSCAITPIDMSNGAENKAILFPAIYEDAVFLSAPQMFYVQILSVDGHEIEGAWDKMKTPVYVTPGDHTIKVRVYRMQMGLILAIANGKAANLTIQEFAIKTTAGKSYLISAEANPPSTHPHSYIYSISEFTGTESPTIKVDY